VDKEPEARIAVIDDDPDIREAVRGLLRSVGLHVELFASVQEFLATARPDLPECLVLDVRLPGRSGLDPSRRAGQGKSTPTGYLHQRPRRCRFGP